MKSLLTTTIIVSLLGTPAFAAQPPLPPGGWADGYVIANGIRIHYWRTGGDKPVIIMAHGSSDNGLCWTNLAKELTNEYDIILPDARGHGLSDPPAKSDPPDAQAEDLAGLIRKLKLEKPIVMGPLHGQFFCRMVCCQVSQYSSCRHSGRPTPYTSPTFQLSHPQQHRGPRENAEPKSSPETTCPMTG